MTRFALIAALALSPLVAQAQSTLLSRYEIQRDQNGKLLTISLKQNHQLDDQPTLLDELREEYDAEHSSMLAFKPDEEERPETKDDQATYDQARMAVAKRIKRSDLDNPQLKSEFGKADSKLDGIEYFHLIAAPNDPEALDEGRETKRTIDGIALGADIVLTGDLFPIFSFLVYQQVEALESRRVFYQNELLVALDSPEGAIFTDAEKNQIRSSIFYSRLDIFQSKHRRRARGDWMTYGTKEYRDLQKKCSKRAKSADFGPCFANEKQEIVDYAVKKKSTAFNYDKPYAVRDHRKFLMLTKLGAQFVPVPGILKAAFNRWINGKYVEQRRAEGYLHGELLLQGKTDLAQWVIINSANSKMP